ncbi:MAG: 50S ribosomal protein L3 N(5)-glutamine methyltransferase [Xanthomonadales bacterium]|nr:50S ribosomal protein L3 N(5)-glutamine methyltransferase [Xanthomonadales bacterium]
MKIPGPTTGLRTIRDYIRWGTSALNRGGVFCGHGMGDTVDEAAYLVAHAVALAPVVPEGFLDSALTPEERAGIEALVEKRIATRRPAAYLTGEAWFAGLRFHVDERVLVPRSPIAELIEAGMAPWLTTGQPRVLDLGTGSGCIAVACAVHLDAVVDAVDLSADALEVAALNVADYGLQESVRLIRSDLFAGLSGRRYDLIITNPPYVGAEEMAQLPDEYRHEPDLGLRSGADGLDIPLRILAEAGNHLDPDGTLFLEVGATAPVLDDALPEAGFEWLSFERGGDGVAAIGAEQLAAIRSDVEALLQQRERHGQ